MTKEEQDVLIMAARWWRNQKPLAWSKAQHLEGPEINCVGLHECRLARAVSKLVKQNKRKP